jgi:hypothetical protein
MTASDYALGLVCLLMLWLCLRLFMGCTVAAVSVDCPIARDATGEAGAQP